MCLGWVYICCSRYVLSAVASEDESLLDWCMVFWMCGRCCVIGSA